MTDFLSATAIKDFLAECPICTEEFDETNRIPRRMPCCVQSICQPCLETYSRGRQTLSCPLCRHQHHLPGGVKSLPKEPLILKILDHLKIQQGLHLSCTNCSEKNQAVAKCENCSGFLCYECLGAHNRVQSLRDHKISTFKEMKDRSVESFSIVHQCVEHKQPQQFYCYTCNKVICVSCTVVDHDKAKGHHVVAVEEAHQERARLTDGMLKKLEEKFKILSNSLVSQKNSMKNIKESKKRAEEEIIKTIEKMVEELQQRRSVLLSEVEVKYNTNVKLIEQATESTAELMTRMESSLRYLKDMRSKADKIEDLQLMVSSQGSLNNILHEKSQDVKSDRIVTSFDQAHIKQLTSNIKTIGVCMDTCLNDSAHASTGKLQRFKLVYIFLYNLFQFGGCFYFASSLFTYGPEQMINGLVILSFLSQCVACLEIVHPLLGIAKSGVFASLARVAGRHFTVCIFITMEIVAWQHEMANTICWHIILFWSSEGIIRYLFHILSILGVVVKPVIWLRYSAWILLCFLEILLNGAVAIWCIPVYKTSEKYRSSMHLFNLTCFLHVYPFLLLYVGCKRMKDIFKKRKEKLGVTGQDDKKKL